MDETGHSVPWPQRGHGREGCPERQDPPKAEGQRCSNLTLWEAADCWSVPPSRSLSSPQSRCYLSPLARPAGCHRSPTTEALRVLTQCLEGKGLIGSLPQWWQRRGTGWRAGMLHLNKEMMPISAPLSIGLLPLLKQSFGAVHFTSKRPGKKMHSHNKIRPMGLRTEAQPRSSGLGLPLAAKAPPEFPHSLSPRVFWRRSCLACSLVMRFLPSRYSFIFWKGRRERTIRLLKKQQKKKKKITDAQLYNSLLIRGHLVSDPIATRCRP